MNTIAMKQPNTISQGGQNWQWPEQTWFRQRLSAVKAEENQQRRRPIVSPQQPTKVTSPEAGPVDVLKAE